MCIQTGKVLIESLTRKLLLETVEILNIKKVLFRETFTIEGNGGEEEKLGTKEPYRWRFFVAGNGVDGPTAIFFIFFFFWGGGVEGHLKSCGNIFNRKIL